jgi:carboxypeptidase Q
MHRHFRILAVMAVVAIAAPAQEKVDLETVYRIKQEAIQNSKVMDHLFYLTDVYGPRLAGSTNYKTAADWVVKTLESMGLKNVKQEAWGPFGRSWNLQHFSANMLEPSYQPLIGFPLAWTGSTDGVMIGEPVYAPIQNEQDMEKWKGKLKGKIVLTSRTRILGLDEKPDARRYDEKELSEIAMAPALMGRSPFGDDPAVARVLAMLGQPNMQAMMAFRRKLPAFLREEGVAAIVQSSTNGDMGTVFGASGGDRAVKAPATPPGIVLAAEHYNRIARLLEHNIPVKLELEVKSTLSEGEANSFNIVGEIPGTGKHKDEIVMVGGHFDSWHGGTGATDNGAGSAVMMEVMRILTALKLPLDRTVRIGLWDAEEEGLLGSRAYVKEHFADPTVMKTTAEWDKFDAYYNVDNGGGKIRGIYLQGNEMVRPIFEAWLAPFKDMGADTITIRNTSGTDHLSFDAVGLPGFQFIQDPMDYDTRTHHSNMDVYDRIQRGDMMQMSAIVTSLVYDTANRAEKLPRKPKPEPRPARGMMF